MIPDLIDHVRRYESYLQFNYKLYEILEGQLRTKVEDSLREELISLAAYSRAIKRIPSINVLRKATDKLSKIYTEPPSRITNQKTDQEILESIEDVSGLNSIMHDATRLYNTQRAFAIEPYVDERKQKFRVLAAHQFLPYSDDPVNPNRMTAFIKFLGNENDAPTTMYNEAGKKITEENIREVTILAVYTATEFMIIDTAGRIRYDLMEKMGIMETVNPFGRIPFVYRSKSTLQLIPYPNQEGYDISILIPKLLTDLNYAAQFQSHSIIWTKNTDLSGQEINPDAVVNLGDQSLENGSGDPEIGTIDPKVDIENILRLIEYETSGYFSSIGIKVQTNGTLSNGRDASGLAKAIDEGDITDERKVQTEMFRTVERELWELTKLAQDMWSDLAVVEENRKFSPSFIDSFRIKFAEMKPFKSERQLLEEIQLWRDQKLMTRKQALRTLRPEFTEEQIDAWIKELDKEAEEDMEFLLENGMPRGPEHKADGTFNEENQAASNQTEESKPTVKK
jgi:hypothetical protein